MSQKTNLKVLKIQSNDDWMSRGFYKNDFPKLLEEDYTVREFLKTRLPKGITEAVEIERMGDTLKVIIKTSRPALVIGRGGEEVEKIKKQIDKLLGKNKGDVKVEIVSVKEIWGSASLASQWIANQLERRMPFRRCLKMSLSKIMATKGIVGARVEVAGRLNGIDIARREWLQEGELPRQRIRAIMEYGFAEAYCLYGVIGVKVWIYKGDKF